MNLFIDAQLIDSSWGFFPLILTFIVSEQVQYISMLLQSNLKLLLSAIIDRRRHVIGILINTIDMISDVQRIILAT